MILFILIAAVFTALDQVQVLADTTPPTRTYGDTCGEAGPRDCADLKDAGFTKSGVYEVYLSRAQHANKIFVYCDFDAPGENWLVIQRRKDGSVSFERNWDNYTQGFGDVNGEFWLGNENLHQLMSVRSYKLRIDLEDFENQKRFAEYGIFSIGPVTDYYRLKVGIYSGDAGDDMKWGNNQLFATFDVDSSTYTAEASTCAKKYRGAWWYVSETCHGTNPNGVYFTVNPSERGVGLNWEAWHGHFYSLKVTEMKIAPLK